MYTGLMHTHRLLAYLLLFSTTLSAIIAVVNALLGSRPRLVKAGVILHRRFEVALGGLLLILGVVMWALIARGIKPTLARLQEGADQEWLWAGQAVMLWLWITGIFYIMQVN